MTISRRQLLAGAAAGALAAGLTACGSGDRGSSAKAIKVGTVPALYWAAWSATPDALKKAGSEVNLELVPFKSSADAFVALRTGDIQMTTMGMNVMASGLASDPSMPISTVAGVSPGRSQLLFRADSGLAAWDDIRGRKVGVIRGSTDELIFRIALAKNGIDMDADTQVTTLQAAADLLLALRNGDIDATVTYQPYTAQAVSQGVAFEPKDLNSQLTEWASVPSDLYARNELIESDPDSVQAIVDQFISITKTFSDHDVWVDTALQYQTGDADLLVEALDGAEPWFRMEQQTHREMAAAMAEHGTVSTDVGDALVATMNYDLLVKATGESKTKLGASA